MPEWGTRLNGGRGASHRFDSPFCLASTLIFTCLYHNCFDSLSAQGGSSRKGIKTALGVAKELYGEISSFSLFIKGKGGVEMTGNPS